MKNSLVWFRRDLRLHDHVALAQATKKSDEVFGIFIFDPAILDQIEDKTDQRVQFIHDSIVEMEETLNSHESSLEIRFGAPKEEILDFCKKNNITDVFVNKDYEPQAKKRDEEVSKILAKENITLHFHIDSVVFEASSTFKDDGTPYKVFTPYMRKWMSVLNQYGGEVAMHSPNLKKMAKRNNPRSISKIDWMKEIGFNKSPPYFKAGTIAGKKQLKEFSKKISDYGKMRDFPAADATSNTSVYIRHGNISVRDMVRAGKDGDTDGHHKWLAEVVWREFYQCILDQFPYVTKGSFKPQYDDIKWRGTSAELEAWKIGETGFPIVDSAMRCLKATGTMPNRLRMVVASFLCKTLLIDWRKGEAWFAAKLLDFDLAANNGGWQWSASSGVDAQPYFRIFNPYSQSEKFDKDGVFIRTWCPELSNIEGKYIHAPHTMTPMDQQLHGCIIGEDYPVPIVDYSKKRMEALEMYKEAVKAP